MTSKTIYRFAMFGVLLGLLCLGNKSARAQADDAIFIGTHQWRNEEYLPASITNAVAFDQDAEHNRYLVDATQAKLFRVDGAGNLLTIASGIGQADIDVNWRGDVLVADTTHNRVILEKVVDSGYQEIVLASLPQPKSILSVQGNRSFFLSGNTLYSLSGSDAPVPMATVDGAILLTRRYGTNAGNSFYILSKANGTYQVSLYTFSGQTGSLGPQTLLPVDGTLMGFHVDTFGNYLLQTGSSSAYQVVLIASPASPIPGLTVTLYSGASPSTFFAFDKLGGLYFADASQIIKRQFGEIDLGVYSYDSDPRFASAYIDVNFAKQPDEWWNYFEAQWTAPFGPLPPFLYGGECWLGMGFCTFEAGVYPTQAGSSRADLIFGDKYKLTFIGRGITGRTYVLAPAQQNTVRIPSTLVAKPTYIEPLIGDYDIKQLYVIDQATNQLVAIDPTTSAKTVLSNGLTNVNSLSIGFDGKAYVTQKDIPGVKQIAADGTTAQLYTQFEHPTGWGNDVHTNIFIANNDQIYSIRTGETEAILFADPSATYGLSNLVTMKCHTGSGNVYAAYSSGGPRGTGGIVKITPTGKMSLLDIKIDAIAGFGFDDGENLYVSDAKRKVLALETSTGKELVLVKGLKTPLAVAVSHAGFYGVADPGSGAVIGSTSSNYGLDFGNVPVGVTVTRTFYLLNSGSKPDAGGFWTDTPNSDYSDSRSGDLATGDLQTISESFQPHATGLSTQPYLFTTVSGYHNHFPSNSDTMTGNGIDASLTPARFSLVSAGPQTHGQGIGVRVLALDAAGKIITGYSQQLLLRYSGPFAGAVVLNLTNGVGTATLDGLCPGVFTLSIEEGTSKGQMLLTVKDQGVPTL